MICEAFKAGTLRACWDCGYPYWVHSHEYIPSFAHPATRPRARHRIISLEDATGAWIMHGLMPNTTWQVTPDPEPDTRPRYQIMQDRHVSISKFVAAHIIKGRAAAHTQKAATP